MSTFIASKDLLFVNVISQAGFVLPYCTAGYGMKWFVTLDFTNYLWSVQYNYHVFKNANQMVAHI